MSRRSDLPPWVLDDYQHPIRRRLRLSVGTSPRKRVSQRSQHSRRFGRPYQPPLRRPRAPRQADMLSDLECVILGVLIGVSVLCMLALLVSR